MENYKEGDQLADISYIIPTFNNVDVLKKCLHTLLPETVKGDKVIIVDDGGSDGTYEYLMETYKEDTRFIILHQENQGQGVARNLGLDHAVTEYVWFVDSDDLLVEGARRKVKGILDTNEWDILIFGYTVKKSRTEMKNVALKLKYLDYRELMLTDHFPCNKIFRRKLFDVIRFPEKKFRFEDHATIPKVLHEADHVNYLNTPLYVYDLSHETNVSKNEKLYDHMYIACNCLVDYFREGGEVRKGLEPLLINTFLFNRMYSSRDVSFSERKREFMEMERYLNESIPGWQTSEYLDFSFWKKYHHMQHYTFVKLFNIKLFSRSPLAALLILHPFNSLKNSVKKIVR